MSNAETAQLCAEIRKTLIETVGKTGGHLASNLGIVELTVALPALMEANSVSSAAMVFFIFSSYAV